MTRTRLGVEQTRTHLASGATSCRILTTTAQRNSVNTKATDNLSKKLNMLTQDKCYVEDGHLVEKLNNYCEGFRFVAVVLHQKLNGFAHASMKDEQVDLQHQQHYLCHNNMLLLKRRS